MTVEIISGSISMKVWDWARIKLATPGSAVRHITDCANGPDVGSDLRVRTVSKKIANQRTQVGRESACFITLYSVCYF